MRLDKARELSAEFEQRGLIPLAEAAQQLGVEHALLLEYVRAGRVRSERVRAQYYGISRAELDRLGGGAPR